MLIPLPFLFCAASQPPSDWSHAAMEDLTAMHDIIQANHPGPVDPRNPAFDDWLNGGEQALMPLASTATTKHAYQLVLRDYANGFADGHLNITMTDSETHLWPGFLVRADKLNGPVRVSVLAAPPEAPSGLTIGDQLLACGGVPVGRLLQDRVVRPLLNRSVPQRLMLKSAWLMVADADDPVAQTPACVFQIGGTRKTIPLTWHKIDPRSLTLDLQKSGGIDIPPIGVRKIGDVWLISLPTFDPQDGQIAQMQNLITFVQTNDAMLHQARHLVIDLRGNDGGDDDWGDSVLAALWSDDAVTTIENSVNLTVDWRVSAQNIAALRLRAADAKAQGQSEDDQFYTALADQMTKSANLHKVYMEQTSPAGAHVPKLNSPFAHPVYLLTSPYCASACLDVIDVANDLPGIIRVGMETSSDTDYLDTASATLPSGHAVLHYAMKVFRNRPRAANASYKPQIAWQGGQMTDASIARWIDTLP
jgi:hypothetical protein